MSVSLDMFRSVIGPGVKCSPCGRLAVNNCCRYFDHPKPSPGRGVYKKWYCPQCHHHIWFWIYAFRKLWNQPKQSVNEKEFYLFKRTYPQLTWLTPRLIKQIHRPPTTEENIHQLLQCFPMCATCAGELPIPDGKDYAIPILCETCKSAVGRLT